MAPPSLPTRIFEKLIYKSPSSKIQTFFDETTRTSLQSNLEEYFHPSNAALQRLENDGLWETFDACSTNNTSNKPCWNEDSFLKYLGTKHPEIVISKESVHLLWKIFQYYAYHPFAPKSPKETIDADGFRRAILLLPIRCTELLGTLEHDFHWTMQNDRMMSGNVERIFRIIGDPYITTSVEDVMDSLGSIQPVVSYGELPSPRQVESTARRLVGDDPTQSPFQVSRKDISSLLDLLLRLQVTKANFGTFSYEGSFDKTNSTYNELAEIMVDSMIGHGVEFMQSDQIHRALAALPNFYGRFQLLWAILFQPSPLSGDQNPCKLLESIPKDVIGALSLMLLPSDFSSRSQYTVGPYAWETTAGFLVNQNDLTVAHIVECLVQHSSPRLMLFTTNETSTLPQIVWGVYFVGPLWIDSNSEEQHLELRSNFTTHYSIFQIKPEFQWTKSLDSETPLKFLKSDNSTASKEFLQKCKIWKSRGEGSSSSRSRKARGVSLRLDFDTKSVLLSGGSQKGQEKRTHRDLPSDIFIARQNVPSSENLNELELPMGFDEVQVLNISGGGDLNDGFLKPYDSRYVLSSLTPTVSSEEIKSRIQGFGST